MKRLAWVLILALMASAGASAQVEIADFAFPSEDFGAAVEALEELAGRIGGMEPVDDSGRAYRRGDYHSGAFTQISVEDYVEDAAGMRVENLGYQDVSICGVIVGMDEEVAHTKLSGTEIQGSALYRVWPEYAVENERVFECGDDEGFVALTVEGGRVASFVYQNFEDADWYY
ncbi:MAG: hypothetical protein GX592_02915 [Clostridiales bacterium]|mgnify:CR=1 FL=1|nr:hypothetical protein [Clostridiales bacterium]